MNIKKIILVLLFVFGAALGRAQNKGAPVPPEQIDMTYTFTSPELRVDSVFAARLDSLFMVVGGMLSGSKEWIHNHFSFVPNDSLSYTVVMSRWTIPDAGAAGFFEHDGYIFWLDGKIPPGIILETKPGKVFSSEFIVEYDPSYWILIYDAQTGRFEFK